MWVATEGRVVGEERVAEGARVVVGGRDRRRGRALWQHCRSPSPPKGL